MKYVTFIKELTKKCADILPYILMLSVILDVLFFRSQICPTSRLNFHILKKVLETRHLEEIDYKMFHVESVFKLCIISLNGSTEQPTYVKLEIKAI